MMGQGSSTQQVDSGEFLYSYSIRIIFDMVWQQDRLAVAMFIERCLFFVSAMLSVPTPQIDLADGGSFSVLPSIEVSLLCVCVLVWSRLRPQTADITPTFCLCVLVFGRTSGQALMTTPQATAFACEHVYH